MKVSVEYPKIKGEINVRKKEDLQKLISNHFIQWKFGHKKTNVLYDHKYLVNKE